MNNSRCNLLTRTKRRIILRKLAQPFHVRRMQMVPFLSLASKVTEGSGGLQCEKSGIATQAKPEKCNADRRPHRSRE
jgi:hypothetical protein